MILLSLLWSCAEPCHHVGDDHAYLAFLTRHLDRPPCDTYHLHLRGRRAEPSRRLPGANGATFHFLRAEDSELASTDWAAIRAPGASFEDVDLSGSTFGGAELADLQATRVRLAETSFAGARLDGARMSEVQLDRANLRGASLREAVIEATSAHEAELWAADLTGARLTGLSGADLRGARLRGAELGSCERPFSGALDAVDLREGTLRVVDWSQLTLREVDLRGADLAACESTGAPVLCTGVELDEHTRLPPHLDAEAFCPGLPPADLQQLEHQRWPPRGAAPEER